MLARSRRALPPPEVITLPEPRPHLGYWHRGVQFRFPTTDFGRWRQAQRELQEQLGSAIIQRTLPVPRHSWLARERTYLLAGLVHDYGTGRHRRPIRLAELREIVTTWMQTVNTSVRATWRGSGRHVDSDDIRWLSTQLTLQDGEELQPPWPSVDQPHTGKWAWQAYSPELTLTLAEEIVREALIGYRQLVETNFATFGDALGLYSMLPVRVEGLVGRFADEDDASSVEMLLVLHPDPAQRTIDPLRVDLRLITRYHDPAFCKFSQDHRHAAQTTFSPHPLQDLELPLHVACPATNLAYQWLARDLAAVGWLTSSRPFLN